MATASSSAAAHGQEELAAHVARDRLGHLGRLAREHEPARARPRARTRPAPGRPRLARRPRCGPTRPRRPAPWGTSPARRPSREAATTFPRPSDRSMSASWPSSSGASRSSAASPPRPPARAVRDRRRTGASNRSASPPSVPTNASGRVLDRGQRLRATSSARVAALHADDLLALRRHAPRRPPAAGCACSTPASRLRTAAPRGSRPVSGLRASASAGPRTDRDHRLHARAPRSAPPPRACAAPGSVMASRFRSMMNGARASGRSATAARPRMTRGSSPGGRRPPTPATRAGARHRQTAARANGRKGQHRGLLEGRPPDLIPARGRVLQSGSCRKRSTSIVPPAARTSRSTPTRASVVWVDKKKEPPKDFDDLVSRVASQKSRLDEKFARSVEATKPLEGHPRAEVRGGEQARRPEPERAPAQPLRQRVSRPLSVLAGRALARAARVLVGDGDRELPDRGGGRLGGAHPRRAEPPPAAAVAPRTGAHAFRYLASEINRWMFRSWGLVQAVLGVVLLALLWSVGGSPRLLAAAALVLVLLQVGVLGPMIAAVGREIDFLARPLPPELGRRFGIAHGGYVAVDLVKMVALAAIAFVLCAAPDRSPRRFDALPRPRLSSRPPFPPSPSPPSAATPRPPSPARPSPSTSPARAGRAR